MTQTHAMPWLRPRPLSLTSGDAVAAARRGFMPSQQIFPGRGAGSRQHPGVPSATQEQQSTAGAGGDEEPGFVPWSRAQHQHITDGFLGPLAHSLRRTFVERVGNPRYTKADRFVWDYWHVEDQYTLLRTPVNAFFAEDVNAELEDRLLEYAQDKLGCRSLSPLWMSYYVDGCHQGLHADNPHGPWAFVLSLTEWEEREFRGGETMILKPNVLDYWRKFDSSEGTEMGKIFDLIEPKFDRLTVFDPRFPHGVREVRGTRDPLKARLVIHGWFSDPSPFFTGALTEEEATPVLNEVLQSLFEELQTEVGNVTGTLSVRLTISGTTGEVTEVTSLTDTMIPVPGQGYEVPEDIRHEVQDCVQQFLSQAVFPPSEAGDSAITIPLIFD